MWIWVWLHAQSSTTFFGSRWSYHINHLTADQTLLGDRPVVGFVPLCGSR